MVYELKDIEIGTIVKCFGTGGKTGRLETIDSRYDPVIYYVYMFHSGVTLAFQRMDIKPIVLK